MSSKAERFSERVLARMNQTNKRTHEKVEVAHGPTSPTMTKVLSGDPDKVFSVSPDSLEKLERALDLVPGSLISSRDNDTDLVPLPEVSVSAAFETPLSEWLTRMSELTDEEQEKLWEQAEPVLEALKSQVLRSRARGSHLGDT